mgnify:CR=1 FL=1
MVPAFINWSPAQLAFATGYRIDLRSHGMSGRTAYFIGRSGKQHVMGHQHACDVLSRLARLANVQPDNAPSDAQRALIEGKPQCL